MNQRYLMILPLGILLAGCTAPLSQRPVEKQNAGIAAGDSRITPDVVYGHKFGMALTFDMFQPPKRRMPLPRFWPKLSRGLPELLKMPLSPLRAVSAVGNMQQRRQLYKL